jgi:hypothetical protein
MISVRRPAPDSAFAFILYQATWHLSAKSMTYLHPSRHFYNNLGLDNLVPPVFDLEFLLPPVMIFHKIFGRPV